MDRMMESRCLLLISLVVALVGAVLLPIFQTEPQSQMGNSGAMEMDHRFDVESKEALTFLEEHGYVVIKGVLTGEEIDAAKDLCWKFLEHGFGARRGDVTTWDGSANWAASGSAAVGLMNNHGFGQSEFAWYVRDRPKVKRFFERIWNTSQLLVSFDGGSLFRPWQYHERWKTRGGWWHTDQNPVSKPGMQCVQGLVTLFDADESSGGLAVIPKSHLAHAEAYKKDADVYGDYLPLRRDNELGEGKLVTAKAGDLLLWDSRTSHCNQPATVTPKRPADGEPWELIRMVSYVCMTPKSKASEKTLEERKLAVKNHAGSSHWPHIYTSHGSGAPIEPVPEIKFSRNQLELIGHSSDEIDKILQEQTSSV